ncbi:ead/Ea22-like family protein [Salmonella enterica]|uniref:Ead/Ea22-like family protein n=1 Tax=Salmonella enterica TaxID=28901 RepID=A0A5Y5PZ00_SALER|nr:ead/Ea22-like family protein [Salmonella enterica]EBH8640213.1 ead/Ea22-like family protein [Salmonella enterica subsp. enterica serovar Thompson]EBM8587444.1 ead/Ea22-like family protein [Salmonella enterica subsp. enterica serovar Montevideo]EBW2894161.1 ead/Ea22-like family protein [Salmonella enterica subsp. enterica serovar Irumu]EBX2791374.1 ead/Ea22-like family protein [Salmonella enterica subsp. enterica serovar Newport]EBY0375313.1 ead/Ea22-like family protein [Salmonella enterica 
MTIDKQALREAAEKATKGPYVVGHHNINQHGNLSGVYVCQQWKDSAGGVVAECHVNCLTKTSEQVYANAEFIAVANPRTMLALLDELCSANGYASAYEAEKWHYHGLAESEGERADRAEKQVEELTMWIKRLAYSLRNTRPDSKLHIDAMDYLSSKGLISVEDVLR